jgi:hypothetical protein
MKNTVRNQTQSPASAPKPQQPNALPDPREVLRIARGEVLGLQIAQKLF